MPIDPSTTVGAVTLAVADLDRVSGFYERVIGLSLIERTSDGATLGVDGQVLVCLAARPDGTRPRRSTGLFHLALLLPSRRALGQWLRHAVAQGYRLDGAGDHLVSEALYLSDPEGNGIELYRDRPREAWTYDGPDLRMATLPVDVQALLADADDAPFTGLPARTRMGHVHLKVDDLDRTAAFYRDVIGLDRMAALPGARFLSAGGYHHHLGLNTWHSRGAPPPSPDALGLLSYTLVLASSESRDTVLRRIEAQQVAVETTADGPLVRDPAGIGLVLTIS